jgi:hypothetical protein
MLRRLTDLNREQRKLVLSLGTAFATRIPGAIGILWFLPLLRFDLGTEDYANLLAAMSLGVAATFLIGGFSLIGRRLIGEAYGADDRTGEADGFASVVVANVAAMGLASVIILAYYRLENASAKMLIVATLPALGVILTTFDNVRAAYNEHYVTALLQLVFQVTIFTIGFLVAATRHNLILAALVLQSHMILASLVTVILLLRDRPYLLHGRPIDVWRIMREGVMVAMADSILVTMLSLSVVWLQATASATTSAWFATTVRLFQTSLIPVILLLAPLSSYIRMRWNDKAIAQQHAFAKATFWIGLGYGAIVAVALFFASRLYVDDLLHLPAPGGVMIIVPYFVLFGAIVSWKSYSSIAYLVLDESSHLSSWTTAAVGASVILGAVASLVVDPPGVISVFALAAGLSITLVLFWNVGRLIRPTPKPTANVT